MSATAVDGRWTGTNRRVADSFRMYRSDHDAALARARLAFRGLRDAAEEKVTPMRVAAPTKSASATELTRIAERCEALRTLLESTPSLPVPKDGLLGRSLEFSRKGPPPMVVICGFPLTIGVALRSGVWGAVVMIMAMFVAVFVVATRGVRITVDGEGLLLKQPRSLRRVRFEELTDCGIEWRTLGQVASATLTLQLTDGETLRLDYAESAPASDATLVGWARLIRARIGERE